MIGEPTLVLVIIINTIVGLSDKLNVSGVNSVSLPTRKPISKKKKKRTHSQRSSEGISGRNARRRNKSSESSPRSKYPAGGGETSEGWKDTEDPERLDAPPTRAF